MSVTQVEAGPARVRWHGLDGLRGVAVLLVVCEHAGLGPFFNYGTAGVTIFFVLSGFLITGVVRTAVESGTWSPARFYADRAVRLVPALLAVQLVIFAWWAIAGHGLRHVGIWFAEATLYFENFDFLQALPPNPLFPHAWSLAVEEQFYLVWPILAVWILGSGRRRVLVPIAIVVSAVAQVVIATISVDVAYRLIVTNAFALLAGACICLFGWRVRRHATALAVSGVAVALAGLAVFRAAHLPYGAVVSEQPVALGAALVIVAVVSGGATILETTWLRFVGRISYAWYLWHYPVLVLMGGTHFQALPALALSFVAATLSTLYLEEPLRRAWRQRAARTESVRLRRTESRSLSGPAVTEA